MKRLSEDQQAAVEAFVAAFHAHRKSQAALDAARERLVGEAVRLRRLRVPSAPVARLMAHAIGVRPSQQTVRALRSLLRTRMSRATAHQRSGPSETTPNTSG